MYYSVVDVFNLLLGRQDEFTPPRRIRAFLDDGADFKKKGEEFLRYFIERGGLKPTDRILDVGCDTGRMAVPLTKFLDKEGSYEGFDIDAGGINWSTKSITSKYPNFRFQLVDIYNGSYNPKGRHKASEYKFPYENESFDFVFLTSVFTHMLSKDMENYLSEIARVLKKGGRCFVTFFILNAESVKLIEAKRTRLDFKYKFEGYSTLAKNAPESAVAHNEHFIKMLYEKYALEIVKPIHYGSWCGRKDFLSYQDIVVAVKKADIKI
jgi:ubiquinone/menaquinone biosynthesis C-methylase UbiE